MDKRKIQITHSHRIYKFNQISYHSGPVIYWMSRDQRVRDNWALIHAQQQAIQFEVPVIVIFNLVPRFLEAQDKQFIFMLQGLQQVEKDLQKLKIPFYMLRGEPIDEIPVFLRKINAGLLIVDFDPLKIKNNWKQQIVSTLKIPVEEVDAHNIIPCRVASPKQEYGAYTIRPKIHKQLNEFLHPFPPIITHPFTMDTTQNPNENHVQNYLSSSVNGNKAPYPMFPSGESAAAKALAQFIDQKLETYAVNRNNPNLAGTSNLSPYLHFGQISAQKVALTIQNTEGNIESKDSFLEELIVRRELSDNFCFYNSDYDSLSGVPQWAQKTISEHQQDSREYIYTPSQFEQAETHESLWNACQLELIKTGKLHGYLRMYWAKKILEWSPSAAEAYQTAILLNDRYALDGRDPNGYTGVAWAIGGVHDRAWFERPVFGKIRYMNERGCRSKFDVDAYIQSAEKL